MLVGIVQVDDVQVLASSVVVKERHGSKHVEDAEPFCMEGGRDGAAIGGEMDSSGGGEGGEEEKSAVSRNKEEKHGRMEREREREMEERGGGKEGRGKRQGYMERKFDRIRTNERGRRSCSSSRKKR